MTSTLVKKPYMKEKFTKQQLREIKNCMDDPIYFMENYVKIQHPIYGACNFNMHKFQKDIIETFHNNRNSIAMTARQLGKTTTSSAYILWYTQFNNDKSVLIAANKQNQATEIMDRIKFAYEELPHWLKCGVITYNKQHVDFDNGSRIISRATTANASRGLSISLLYLDEFAFVRPNIADDFWSATRPTLSTGGACIITSTPNSDEDRFAQLWYGANDTLDEYGNERSDGLGTNGFKAIKVTWDKHPNATQEWADEESKIIGEERFRREYNCEFIINDETLISSSVLSRLEGKKPLEYQGQIRWYKKPDKDLMYILGLDPSVGTGGDFSAIQLFELPTMIQVAEWKHNKSTPKEQVEVMRNILKKLFNEMKDQGLKGEPEIYWTFENNGPGEAIRTVIEDTGEHFFPGMILNEPKKTSKAGARKRRKGLTTTNKTKISAATRLKSLVETNRCAIYSKALISELKGYIRSGAGFEAKQGFNDDLVASLLVCIRMMSILSEQDPDFNEALKESLDISNEEQEPMPVMVF